MLAAVAVPTCTPFTYRRIVPPLSKTPAIWVQLFSGIGVLEVTVYWVPLAPNTQNTGPLVPAVSQIDIPKYWVAPFPTLALVEKSKNRARFVKRLGFTQPSTVRSPPMTTEDGTSYQHSGRVRVPCPTQSVEVPEIVSPKVRDWVVPVAPLSLMYSMLPFCVRL